MLCPEHLRLSAEFEESEIVTLLSLFPSLESFSMHSSGMGASRKRGLAQQSQQIQELQMQFLLHDKDGASGKNASKKSKQPYGASQPSQGHIATFNDALPYLSHITVLHLLNVPFASFNCLGELCIVFHGGVFFSAMIIRS
jgi:hypothetical protein